MWNLKLSFLAVLSHSVLRKVPTDDRPRDDPRGVAGVSGAVREWTAIRGSNRQSYYTDLQHPSFRVVCSERVNCANAFRMGSSNSSFATKSCHSHS
jgi:hypothetical protein